MERRPACNPSDQLTAMQERFIAAVWDYATADPVRAGELAGYRDPAVSGPHLLHSQRVRRCLPAQLRPITQVRTPSAESVDEDMVPDAGRSRSRQRFPGWLMRAGVRGHERPVRTSVPALAGKGSPLV